MVSGSSPSGEQPGPVKLISLPVEALAMVLSELSSDPKDLLSVELTCRFLRDLDVDDAAWCPACLQLWAGKPRWERQAFGASTRSPPPGPSWKHCYRDSLLKSREPLGSVEMQSLRYETVKITPTFSLTPTTVCLRIRRVF